jgi:hypothetical protein
MSKNKASSAEDYPYVEHAIRGLYKRNDVRHIDESLDNTGRVECYRSMLRFPPSLLAYKDDNDGSARGYKG